MKNVTLTDQYGETPVEIWKESDGQHYAQAILARGIIGAGSTEARAIQELRAALQAAHALEYSSALGFLHNPNADAARRKAAATTGHIPDQRTDPFDEALELYTHGATSGIADGDDNHITE